MNALARAGARLARVQRRHAWAVLAGCAALFACGAALSARLEVRTAFEELLPRTQPSVVELRRLRERLGQGSAVYVVLEGESAAALRDAAERVLEALRAARPAWLVDASAGVHGARDFLLPRAGLFADRAALERLRDELREAKGRAVLQETGLGLGLEDDAPPALPSAGALLERLAPPAALEALGARWPDGWFQSRDGRALVVLVRTGVPPGDLGRARRALDAVRTLTAGALGPRAAVRASFAGDLVTGLEAYGAVQRDLAEVGATGIALVLGVVLLFFLRLRALGALAAAVALGLALTFGVTRLAVGHLTVLTGFLVSVVAGNGINPGIVLLARHFEARRLGHAPARAVAIAARATWLPTLGGALAAAAAYASLAATRFTGLREFAVVGGAGMLLCWAATYLVVPPLLLVLERRHALRFGDAHEGRVRTHLRALGERLAGRAAAAVVRARGAVLVATAALIAAAAVAGAGHLARDPVEYDMKKLANAPAASGELRRVSALAREVLGVNLESSMVVLVDRLDQVVPLQRALERRRDGAPAGARPFAAVHTLLDLVPADQAGKIPVLREIARTVRQARARGLVPDAEWTRLAALLPPDDLGPFGLEDLPAIASRFTERDGTRGRVLLVEPTEGADEDDLRYLVRFAAAFRETRLPTGETVRGSGRAVIFADMLEAVAGDMPRALALAFALTVASVLVTLGPGRPALAVLAALAGGVALLAGGLGLAGLRLHFVNFVAIPVTFGIGVDYAVNVVHRSREGGGVAALRGVGGAVLLCSLTTTLGYLALLGSANQGVRGLGAVAALGEVCVAGVALLALPAALAVRERRPAGGPRALRADAA